MDWIAFKDNIVAYTGLERDALHIYAAVLIQIAAAFLFRKTLASVTPWLLALVCEVGNELLDAYNDGIVEAWEVQGGLHDLWNTMLIPIGLFLIARLAPHRLAPRGSAAEDAVEPEPEGPAQPSSGAQAEGF